MFGEFIIKTKPIFVGDNTSVSWCMRDFRNAENKSFEQLLTVKTILLACEQNYDPDQYIVLYGVTSIF